MPAGVENDPQALDEFLDGVFDKFSDSGDLLTAVVLSASPTEIKLVRSSREVISITDKEGAGRGGAGADGQRPSPRCA